MAADAKTRFWPLNRNSYPKQFDYVLINEQTMFLQTVERFRDIFLTENLPMQKTAHSIAYARYKIGQICQCVIMIIFPADHVVLNEKELKGRTIIFKYVLCVYQVFSVLFFDKSSNRFNFRVTFR